MSASNFSAESQFSTPLLDALHQWMQTPHAPFYTPGHKRGQGIASSLVNLLGDQVFRADLPELPGLDNLFAAQDVIRDAQALAADTFGADRTWFLVNGSTCGVIAAILATCVPADKIILPRNIHQSVISGLILSGARPIFIQPEYDVDLDIAHSISPQAVETALVSHPDARAILMVYPTYYGVCGDVQAIAQIAHQYGIPLLVDEAHAAHFAFHPELPISALAAGADLSVQSTHKVLSAMTQAAMLHVKGERIDRDRLNKALQLVQSTSPSYLLLASLDAARHQMATQGYDLMQKTLELANCARSQLSQIAKLSLLSPEEAGTPGFFTLDRTRLTVTVSNLGIDGFTADEILNQDLGVMAELPSLQHLTFIISLGNTEADISQLVSAFWQLAETKAKSRRQKAEGKGKKGKAKGENPYPPIVPPLHLSPREVFFSRSESLAIDQTIAHISAESVCPYPPGIPVLLPGEVVTGEAIAYLQQILTAGGTISGCADPSLKTLKVVI
jgi:arginine/lysine/ornithine decarboxylase